MDQATWRKLTDKRVADVKALLSVKRWALAYYVAGYAIECALKVCILDRLAKEPELLFSDRRFSEKCWTHNLEQLVDCAGLRSKLKADLDVILEFQENWKVVTAWSETTRYAVKSKAAAIELFDAITDKKFGGLPWIKRCWSKT